MAGIPFLTVLLNAFLLGGREKITSLHLPNLKDEPTGWLTMERADIAW
jgi:hypothetical protein